MRSCWLAALVVVALGSVARAEDWSDTVALASLDTDQRTELYGQAVASQLARALQNGGIEVVVLAGRNPKMPERMRFAVNGKIEAGKGDEIVLTVIVRDLALGTSRDPVVAHASSLQNLETAAAVLRARLLTTLKEHVGAADR